jgi:hypothetical protein
LKTTTVLAGCALALALWGCDGHSEKGESGAAISQPPQGSGILVIAYAPDSADTLAAFGRDSLTALAWLQLACDSAGISLGVEHYAFGDLVAKIGPRKNGDGGYWLYKVNGGMVPESAGSHAVSPDDTVMFFFE